MIYFADIYLKELPELNVINSNRWLYRLPFFAESFMEALSFYEAIAILYGCPDDRFLLREYVRIIEPLTIEFKHV